MAETLLTQEAYDRLRAEHERLTTEGRQAVTAAIAEARQHGDLRENAEYHSAKEEQGRMEARIRQLEQLLESAVVGEPETTDQVAPGHVITIEIGGTEEVYFVGSREDSVGELDILSPNAPMGQALLGARVGETRAFTTPSGETTKATVRAITTP